MAQSFWLIPFLPALGALVLILFGRAPRPEVGRAPGLLARCSLSLVASAVALVALLGSPPAGLPGWPRRFSHGSRAGRFSVGLAFRFDPLTAVMSLVVTGVGFLIHVYSAGYMARDRDYARYFASSTCSRSPCSSWSWPRTSS